METVSPDSMVSRGASLGSSQPHCTFSGVALRTWCFPANAAIGSATTATKNHRDMVPPVRVGVAGTLAPGRSVFQQPLDHGARDVVITAARLRVDAPGRPRVAPRQLGEDGPQVLHPPRLQSDAAGALHAFGNAGPELQEHEGVAKLEAAPVGEAESRIELAQLR